MIACGGSTSSVPDNPDGSTAPGVPECTGEPVGTKCTGSGAGVCDGTNQCVACNVAAIAPATKRAPPTSACHGVRHGVKDGTESDVDCGGSCGGCARTKKCMTSTDCASGICNSALLCDEQTTTVPTAPHAAADTFFFTGDGTNPAIVANDTPGSPAAMVTSSAAVRSRHCDL